MAPTATSTRRVSLPPRNEQARGLRGRALVPSITVPPLRMSSEGRPRHPPSKRLWEPIQCSAGSKLNQPYRLGDSLARWPPGQTVGLFVVVFEPRLRSVETGALPHPCRTVCCLDACGGISSWPWSSLLDMSVMKLFINAAAHQKRVTASSRAVPQRCVPAILRCCPRPSLQPMSDAQRTVCRVVTQAVR